MGKFISIGGMRYDGSRNRDPRPRISNHQEFWDSRDETSHSTSGFTPGDEIMIRGEHAIVMHEEHDPRSGETITWCKANSQSDSGTVMVRWAPDQQRSMKIRDVRRTRD